MNILISSAGRRVSLVRAFKKELVKYFPDGQIFTVDMKPELSSACRISDKYFQVPAVTDKSYCEKLIGICKNYNVKIIVPTIDTELLVLAENRENFLKEGIKPIISSTDIVMMCRDKRKTHKYFDSIGFPRSREIDLNNFQFPVFAKPSDGSGSIGIQVIRNRSQLTDPILNDEKIMLLEYYDPEKFREFTIDMYFDRFFNLKCAVPRERIEVRTGEVSKAVTRKDDLYKLICNKFAHCEGFLGCITMQVFRNKNSNELLGIEINPRFGGGYPLSYHANANYPGMIIKEYLLNKNLPFFDNWTENMLMLRYDDEIIINDYKG